MMILGSLYSKGLHSLRNVIHTVIVVAMIVASYLRGCPLKKPEKWELSNCTRLLSWQPIPGG